MKAGVDSPENLLSYADFDGDFKTDGQKDELVKTWAPHLADWQPGDPVWQETKGKGLIGLYWRSDGEKSYQREHVALSMHQRAKRGTRSSALGNVGNVACGSVWYQYATLE